MPVTPRAMSCSVLLVAVLVSFNSRAEVTPVQCVDAHETVQNLRSNGKLVEARTAARLCANRACPAAVSGECIGFVRELESEVPTVILRVVDRAGRDLIDIKVMWDDAVLTMRLDGRAIAVNPGRHDVVAIAPDGTESTASVVVRQAEANQRLGLRMEIGELPKEPEPPAAEPGPDLMPAAWGTLGVGVAGLAVFGVMAGIGWSERSDLDSCGTACPDSEVDPIRTKLIVADVALGVGLASLAVSTVLFLVSGDDADAVEARGNRPLTIRF
jgi:hypothetical protein